MAMRHRLSYRSAFLPALGLLTLAYFAIHAVQGKYGLIAYRDLEQEKARLIQQIEAVDAQLAELERQRALMHPDALDRDWLDESARRNLALAHPDDLIILTPEK